MRQDLSGLAVDWGGEGAGRKGSWCTRLRRSQRAYGVRSAWDLEGLGEAWGLGTPPPYTPLQVVQCLALGA